MSERDPELEFTPEERALHERVVRAVRALPPEPPSAPFRALMRERFVGAAEGTGAPAGTGASAPRARRGFLSAMRPIEIALAAAGLAIVLSLGAYVMNAGPRWHVADTGGVPTGNLVVDGEPVPAGDAGSLDDALTSTSHLVWEGDGDLVLHSDGGAVIALTPGTEVTMPAPPPRWFARSTSGRVERGTIRVMTGPRFRGASLTFDTPQAQVEVTGTALAVICEPAVTCVCVFEGTVEVRGPAEQSAMVPAGQRRTLFADGRPTEQADMRPSERMALDRMRREMGSLLE
jgi:hypothetical protein